MISSKEYIEANKKKVKKIEELANNEVANELVDEAAKEVEDEINKKREAAKKLEEEINNQILAQRFRLKKTKNEVLDECLKRNEYLLLGYFHSNVE